jgi:hypothetical protein
MTEHAPQTRIENQSLAQDMAMAMDPSMSKAVEARQIAESMSGEVAKKHFLGQAAVHESIAKLDGEDARRKSVGEQPLARLPRQQELEGKLYLQSHLRKVA